MAVVIKKMNIPESCYSCDIRMNCDACEGHEMYCPFVGHIGYDPESIGVLVKGAPICPTDHRAEGCPLEQEPHGEWISCSERLPEDERPVLIYAWNVHHVVARYGRFRTEDGGHKNAWVTAGAWFDNTEIKHKILAWMPLPEPYKKKTPCENCIDDSDCDKCDVPRSEK